MGTDIIIALKKDPTYNELKFALRSIDANLTGYRNIYLIGAKPHWVQNIIHIPLSDLSGKKQYSIFRKFLEAAKTPEVSENFIRWDDDVYLLQPLDVSDIKHWHGGTLEEWTYKNIATLYRNVIKNTHKLFPDGLYYDIHAPRVFNKEKYKALSLPWSQKELLTKSSYFNSVETNPVYMADPKREKGMFYSTNGLRHDDHLMLKRLFPNPSRYETDYKANTKAAFGLAEATG